jgi:DNA-binding transcriptional LysR family regulator
VTPNSRHTFNDPELVLQAVREGHGLARLAGYQVREALRDGVLLSCLDAFAPDDRGHYICYLSRKHLPARIRVFVDYMIEQTRALDAERTGARAPVNERGAHAAIDVAAATP